MSVTHNPRPEPALLAAPRAARLGPRQRIPISTHSTAAALLQAAKDISRPAPADMRIHGALLAVLGARVLLVERDNGPVTGRVRVAGAAAARVEAAGGGAGGGGGGGGGRKDGGGGDARGRGGARRTEKVACAAATRVGVAVLGDRWVRLGDGV